MSFRAKLLFFFAIIVIVPLVATGAVVFSLARNSEQGKADAEISTAFNVATSIYSDARREAAVQLRALADDARIGAAVREESTATAARRLRAAVRSHPSIVSAALLDRSGAAVARVGPPGGVAAAAARLNASGTSRAASLTVSTTRARDLVAEVRRRTRLQAVVLRDGSVVASTAPTAPPAGIEQDFEARGRDYRGRRARVGRAAGVTEELGVFLDIGGAKAAIADTRLMTGAILLAFLLLGLASAVVVVRALHKQVGRLLEAARRLAAGHFDQRVHTEGGDELAQLGEEFNRMSEQLETKIEEVQRGRRRLAETVRRVGEAFATGLDVQGIFELTVRTAVEACEAEGGFGAAVDERLLSDVRVGPEALAAAAKAPTAGVHRLAVPLRARPGASATPHVIAELAVARGDRAFTREEAEIFEYLAGQAVISIENANLHEAVQRQAVTDELTGLANVREMQSVLDREFERGRRFDTPVGLVLLDIDDFKRINDSHGHLQGDEVLRRVAGVLRGLARELDEPARYGGEELAVVLPQTPIEGAVQLAERMRERVADLHIPLLDGSGHMGVTASFGVASVPTSASEKDDLIAAADAALYRAKRGGKNRVEQAGAAGSP